MTISTVQNYGDKIMQSFTTPYNLEFRKLTFYCLTRPQSIRKSKQISGQMILSSPQDLEFNPNFAKNRDIPVAKNSVMHQSIPPASSPPPGQLRGICPPCQSRRGGGAFANVALPGGWTFANPRANPELLTRTRFPIRT